VARLSVVIASGAGGGYLFRCLDSLREQATSKGVEVIVVDRCGGEHAERVVRDHPFVTLVRAEELAGLGLPARPSVPQLRAVGARRASGDVVCVIEEHCAAAPNWLDVIERSWREGDAAIGGPVADSAFRHPRDWAIYFSEFHNYLPPWQEGERLGLNGVNIAYSREKLLAEEAVLGDGYWEVVLHPRLAKHGTFRSVPEMVVHHAGPFDYREYLEQRYLLSRVWGAGQRETASAAKRLVYLVAAPVFPLLLLLRIASRTAASGFVPRYLYALPLLVPIACAYVLGEWCGYAFGMGDALERVE
jgi:hypothetical protein